MRKLLTGVAGMAAVFSLGTGQAQAAELKGGIKGEPDASLSLIVKKINGERYVTRVSFKDVPVRCDSGRSETSGAGPAGKTGDFGLEVKQREFSGPWHYGKIDGKFKGAGKVAGQLSMKFDAGSRGECRSGKLDYVVRD